MTMKTQIKVRKLRWSIPFAAAALLGAAGACSVESSSRKQAEAVDENPEPQLARQTSVPKVLRKETGELEKPGQPCTEEGQYLRCGKVTAKLEDQVVCGSGYSQCTDGVWSECVINNAEAATVPFVPQEQQLPGSKAQGLGAPSPCTNNPCDPYCVDFPDDPSGLVDAGTNIKPGDGGLVTNPDAGPLPCTPKTCAALNVSCGPAGDGCGGLLACGGCPAGQTCGGGGVASKCGMPTSPCVPKTCASAGATCGQVADGCGGLTPNCGSCTGTDICGGAGTPNVCGTPTPPCTPKTCAQLAKNCGQVNNGCGGLTANCGTCTAPQTCGGAGTPNVCGNIPPLGCTPKTCAQLGKDCGPVGDGCGNLLQCGSCTGGKTCGGGGVPGVCGGGTCTPKTCAQLGKNCGQVSDGCGGLTANCGACSAPLACGAGGTPNVCGSSIPCVNFCTQQCGNGATCPTVCAANQNGGTTSVTGIVYAPNGTDPLPNVLVYVPNGSLTAPYGVVPFTPGVSCDNCAVPSGSPLVTATTDVNGKFVLKNMPVGSNIPIVIQVGRWRRTVIVPTVTKCVDNWASGGTPAAPTTGVNAKFRLPRNKSEGDIPKMAFSTGAVDSLECVWRKIGIDDAEFTNPLGDGRIHMYADPIVDDNSGYGAYIGGVGAGSGAARTPAGASEWNYRMMDRDSWFVADQMQATRTLHGAVLLADGTVFVTGGLGEASSSTSLCTASTLPMPSCRPNSGDAQPQATTESYNPTTNTWSSKAPMSAARVAHTTTLLANGNVMVTGGYTTNTTAAIPTVQVYNPGTNTWSGVTALTGGAREFHTATRLSVGPNAGKVLVVGGSTNGTTATNTTSLCDAAGACVAGPNLATARFYHLATLLPNGNVLISGGTSNGTASLSTAELYNAATNTFVAAGTFPAGAGGVRQQGTATVLPNGTVLRAGGVANSTASTNRVDLYNPATNTWSAGPNMGTTRNGHSAVLLDDGVVLVSGGLASDGTTFSPTVELYDPATNTWTTRALFSANWGRAFHTATKLPSGRVLVSGGSYDDNHLFSYAELFVAEPLKQYDIALFPCPGTHWEWDPASTQTTLQTNLANYANIGGRLFTTHFTYAWLHDTSPLAPAVNWNINQGNPSNQLGYINMGFPKGKLMADWMMTPAIAASTTLGEINITTLRHDFDTVVAPTQNWVTIQDNNWTPNPAQMHLTFNTPLGAAPANQCGRVLFSDFHVESNNAGGTRKNYPAECDNAAMTDKERMLEFMLFDLAACISPDPPNVCTPITCASQNLSCGQAGDGCGGILNCGVCPGGQTCGGGGTPGQCGACVPQTCAAQGLSCGPSGDGCGGILNCGACPPGQSCGGGGVPGQCGMGPPCTPTTCASQALNCGPAGNGCGGLLNCGTCTAPQTCGGSGIPGQCGMGVCTPTTCAAQNLSCGPAGDGCGGLLNCGACPAGQTCGGGGVPGKCGAPVMCTPTTCAAQGLSCGQTGDGCGNTLNCGTCAAPNTCGGGGTPGVCGFTNFYTDGWFIRDYDGSSCPSGTAPTWRIWSWDTITPNDSFIEFTVQTATTAAGLAAAPADLLVYAPATGPAPLVGMPVKAHGLALGAPDTQKGSTDVGNTLKLAGRPEHAKFLRITSHLAPATNKLSGPTLVAWDLQMSCAPSE